jgi:hypothetical protein
VAAAAQEQAQARDPVQVQAQARVPVRVQVPAQVQVLEGEIVTAAAARVRVQGKIPDMDPVTVRVMMKPHLTAAGTGLEEAADTASGKIKGGFKSPLFIFFSAN